MSPSESISRREALQRLSVLFGGALSASTMTALVSGCRAAAPADPTAWSPEVLSGQQLDVLTALVDRILPRTDTPGASDVGVPQFVDLLLDRWAEDEERERVLAGLDELGSDFLGLAEAEQIALVTALDAEAGRARDTDEDPLPYFATLKEWTLVGYYTSEAGATEELQWLAVPGRYEADVPLSQVGRTWA